MKCESVQIKPSLVLRDETFEELEEKDKQLECHVDEVANAEEMWYRQDERSYHRCNLEARLGIVVNAACRPSCDLGPSNKGRRKQATENKKELYHKWLVSVSRCLY